MKQYCMELLGTFFLTCAVVMIGQPVGVGLLLMALIYMGAHVSGAHFNPALTLAVWARGGMKRNLVIGYMLSQTLGALVALLVCSRIAGALYGLQVLRETMGTSFVGEAILTGLLALVFLTVTVATKFKTSSVYGFAVGLTFGALLMFPMTNVLNPAIALGGIFASALTGGALSFDLAVLAVYCVAPLVGGWLAAYAYKYFN